MNRSGSEAPVTPSRIWERETFRRILLAAGAAAFFAVLVEVPALANLIDYGRIFGINANWLPRNRVADPELLHAGRPNAHFTGSTLGGNTLLEYRLPAAALTSYRWDVTYDVHGFRNPTDLKSADIAVVGDSFVEGMTVPLPKLLTSVLGNLQGSIVANLGVSGYGPQQELIVLRRYALPLRPRTVVWMFYEGNDLADVEHYDHSVHGMTAFWPAFWERSFTRNALARINHFTKPAGVTASGIVRTPGAGDARIYYFDRQSAFSGSRLTSESLRETDETAQVLRAAGSLCVAHAARLLVVFVPTAFRVLKPFCTFPAESECRTWVPNDLPKRLREAALSASPAITYLDLTAALPRSLAQSSPPYYSDDAHWTEQGHRIAAEAINTVLSAGAR